MAGPTWPDDSPKGREEAAPEAAPEAIGLAVAVPAAPGPGPFDDAPAPAGWPASGVAHSAQNFAVGTLACPHVGQTTLSAEAHSTQNFAPDGFSVPQLEQITPAPSSLGCAAKDRLAAPQSVADRLVRGSSVHGSAAQLIGIAPAGVSGARTQPIWSPAEPTGQDPGHRSGRRAASGWESVRSVPPANRIDRTRRFAPGIRPLAPKFGSVGSPTEPFGPASCA